MLQMLVLDELTYRSGILVMACKVTDVKGREMGLARSLIPNPLAGATEKQVSPQLFGARDYPRRGGQKRTLLAHRPSHSHLTRRSLKQRAPC